MAVVSQQAHMFNMSLRENLLLARADASEADLFAALETAQLADFVSDLPDGVDTWIGESGKRLSAGQARRLAIARLILKDAPLWVLDEPTEGLDIITEHKVMHALFKRMAGRTVLMVTHRLVNLKGMDHIIVLENGSIIEQGDHQSLARRNSRYASLLNHIR
jgi:ATP-binding cassette subfamily C protein CydC